MGKYDKQRFKQIIVPVDVYLRLLAKKRGPLDSIGQVIKRLLDEVDIKTAKPTTLGRVAERTEYMTDFPVTGPVFVAASTKLKIEE